MRDWDIKTIVLGYDGSEGAAQAADLAAWVARKNNSRILVVTVFSGTYGDTLGKRSTREISEAKISLATSSPSWKSPASAPRRKHFKVQLETPCFAWPKLVRRSQDDRARRRVPGIRERRLSLPRRATEHPPDLFPDHYVALAAATASPAASRHHLRPVRNITRYQVISMVVRGRGPALRLCCSPGRLTGHAPGEETPPTARMPTGPSTTTYSPGSPWQPRPLGPMSRGEVAQVGAVGIS